MRIDARLCCTNAEKSPNFWYCTSVVRSIGLEKAASEMAKNGTTDKATNARGRLMVAIT